MTTYGEKLRAKNIGFLAKGRTKSNIQFGTDKDGCKTKSVTDELGNTMVEHNNKQDQVDVHIKAPFVKMVTSQQEVRDA